MLEQEEATRALRLTIEVLRGEQELDTAHTRDLGVKFAKTQNALRETQEARKDLETLNAELSGKVAEQEEENTALRKQVAVQVKELADVGSQLAHFTSRSDDRSTS
ncbi:hypothetical protein DIPPA_02742 [Diplonema papillatum]|nr:hypothetical protein DIPPA_02742 [Diplonema papillatum]